MKAILLKGGFVVTPEGVVRSDIILRDGKIQLTKAENKYDEVIDITGKYVAPGFVDIHFHGYNLFEFTVGLYDPKTGSYDDSPAAYKQGLDKLRKTVAAFGVTGFYIGTWAASIQTLKYCFSQLRDYLSGTDNPPAARIFGGLLEGTFINPKMAGAQDPQFVFEPDPHLFDSIEAGGVIKLANVVPDSGRGSYELIEYLTDKGIIIGFGHTDATYNQVAEAVKAGLKYSIHFTNGPIKSSSKPFHGGGAAEAVLKLDGLYAELICDGYHVDAAYVRDTIERKGTDKILGVTDAVFAAGSGLKEFAVGSMHGTVSENGEYLQVLGRPDTLFSSTLTMNRGFTNVLNWLTTDMDGVWHRRHKALDFEKALTAAAKIYSTNPCKLTGLEKEGFGSVVDGAKADLCLLDITGPPGNYKVTVETTIVDGQIVYLAK